MTHKAPGKSDREGISLIEIMDLFPSDDAAQEWFESRIWKDGRTCPHCGSTSTRENRDKNSSPYRCNDCHGYFSVRVGTVMHGTPMAFG